MNEPNERDNVLVPIKELAEALHERLVPREDEEARTVKMAACGLLERVAGAAAADGTWKTGLLSAMDSLNQAIQALSAAQPYSLAGLAAGARNWRSELESLRRTVSATSEQRLLDAARELNGPSIPRWSTDSRPNPLLEVRLLVEEAKGLVEKGASTHTGLLTKLLPLCDDGAVLYTKCDTKQLDSAIYAIDALPDLKDYDHGSGRPLPWPYGRLHDIVCELASYQKAISASDAEQRARWEGDYSLLIGKEMMTLGTPANDLKSYLISRLGARLFRVEQDMADARARLRAAELAQYQDANAQRARSDDLAAELRDVKTRLAPILWLASVVRWVFWRGPCRLVKCIRSTTASAVRWVKRYWAKGTWQKVWSVVVGGATVVAAVGTLVGAVDRVVGAVRTVVDLIISLTR